MVPKMISNMAAGNISIQLGLRGKCTNVVTACASGTHCIGDAFRAIQYDDADMMLAGGAESCICPTGVAGFPGADCPDHDETDPARASIPFDKDRSGFVHGRGRRRGGSGGASSMRLRVAPSIYAELVGYGATGDAFHITSPSGGRKRRGQSHGAGHERRAASGRIRSGLYQRPRNRPPITMTFMRPGPSRLAFGEAAENVVINSTKSMIGHLLGAAGGVEFVVCAKAVEENYIHQTVGTRETDGECDLNYAIGAPVEKEVRYALTNSLGFGGHNASLLLKKYEA